MENEGKHFEIGMVVGVRWAGLWFKICWSTEIFTNHHLPGYQEKTLISIHVDENVC